MKILITGNVGSGKSTFLKFLQKYVNQEHYDFIDLDKIGKQVVKDYNIVLPEKTTNVFEDPQLLFSLEDKILPHLVEYFPNTQKTLIMEASTLIECPLLLNKEDIIIHITSVNAVKNTFNRDKVENRAFLISRVQVSPWIKTIISDIEIENNSTLDDLEKSAKELSNKLNYVKTKLYLDEVSTISSAWNENFPEESNIILNNIIKQYSIINKRFQLNHIIAKVQKIISTELNMSNLWRKSLILAICFENYYESGNKEENIKKLWEDVRQQNLFKLMIEGSRSYISLACELIYAKTSGSIPNNLNFSDGAIALNYFKSY